MAGNRAESKLEILRTQHALVSDSEVKHNGLYNRQSATREQLFEPKITQHHQRLAGLNSWWLAGLLLALRRRRSLTLC
jgi:hypothetical protein